nr:secondary thiamine-phosphate synthase enzyme YjbQ [Candidatus Njordarchaeum guaymaensis]
MNIMTETIHVESKGEVDITDITRAVEAILARSKLQDGVITIFVPGSTGALTTIEYEDGLLQDLPLALERIAPKNVVYEHEKRWHDGNGHSHVRASIIGPSISVPFVKGKLTLGTWQQLVFVELDTRSRSRDLIAQVVGK